MSAKLGMFLLINVALTVILFMFQISMAGIGAELGQTNITSINFNFNDSVLSSFDSGGYTLNTTLETTLNTVQAEEDQIDEDSGNWFTDTFKTVKNWLLDVTGLNYVLKVLDALPSMLANMFGDTYAGFGFGLGVMWHIITFFALIFWIKGGGQ